MGKGRLVLAGVSEPNSGKTDGSGSEVSLSEGSSSSPSGAEISAEAATSSDCSSAVVGTSAVGSAELEAGVSVAVSPPPQAASTTAAQTMAISLISKIYFLNTKNENLVIMLLSIDAIVNSRSRCDRGC